MREEKMALHAIVLHGSLINMASFNEVKVIAGISLLLKMECGAAVQWVAVAAESVLDRPMEDGTIANVTVTWRHKGIGSWLFIFSYDILRVLQYNLFVWI